MAKYASEIVKLAQSWVGKKESDGSHKAIIDIYNSHKPWARGYKLKYTDEWCAGTISALSIELGYTDIIPTECGCQEMIKLFIKIGSWVEDDAYVPKAGDIIFYDWQDSGVGDNVGYSDHVGVVEKVSGNNITIIEGNYKNAVTRRNIIVNQVTIRGYGVPKYDGVQTTTPTTTKPSTSRNYLMKGDKSTEVKKMQENLIYMGYSCGKYGADGDFGEDTDKAVKAFQEDNKLDVDGKYGVQSKAKLEALVANKKASVNQGNPIIKLGQQHAVNFTGVKITIDGIVGSETNKMKSIVLQHAMNLDYGKTIAEDGLFQTKSKAKLGNHYVMKGETQFMVTAAEILMMLHGIDPNGVECPGKYGNGLVNAAKQFFGDDGTKITASEFLKLIQ